MNEVMILLALYIPGLILAMTLGNGKYIVWTKLIVGAIWWVAGAAILGFTKNIADAAFMGIPWLLTAYVPLLVVIPFYLYLHPRTIYQEVRRDLKPLLVVGVMMFVLGWFYHPVSSAKFDTQLAGISTRPLTPPYRGAEMVGQREKVANYGAELLVNHLGVMTGSRELAYQTTTILMLISFVMMIPIVLETTKMNWKMMAGVGWIMLSLSLRLVVFGDVLNWLMVVTAWLVLYQSLAAKQIILSGIMLAGLLSIESAATVWWVIPSMLAFKPREFGIAAIVATLINPLAIGSIR